MRRKFTGVLLAIILAAFALGVAGCGTDTDAEVASENLSKAAEQFEVDRRVVVYNGITDKVKLEITCALSGVGTGHPQAIKNFAGLSDNVTYYVEQLHPIGVSTTQYRVIFKPEAIIPDFDRP
jgi:hypothetical protein